MSEVCAICGNYFATPAALIDHQAKDRCAPRTDAGPPAGARAEAHRFACVRCGRRFPTAQALADHALRPHAPRVRPGAPAPTFW